MMLQLNGYGAVLWCCSAAVLQSYGAVVLQSYGAAVS